jgi:lipoprotein-anchoring transpeptidase ErfK/SrfK
MRALRVLGLIVVVGAAGLLSGGASGVLPARPAAVVAPAVVAPVAAPAVVPAPAAAPAPVAVPAVAVPAATAPVVKALPVAPAKPALVPGTPCVATARACIALSAKRAWLIRNGVVEYGPVPITSGRAGYRTPTGTFRVTFKDIDHRSSLFNDAPMPNSVFFNGGIAFHQGSLSVPSHGCIHLSRAASQKFFATLNRGDVVQVSP